VSNQALTNMHWDKYNSAFYVQICQVSIIT